MRYDVRTTVHLNIPDLDRSGASLLVVLVKAPVGDFYAAYMGIVKLPTKPHHRLYEKARDLKAQRVAALGSKLTFGEANRYFPAVKESMYR
jgi:hypothetical protein